MSKNRNIYKIVNRFVKDNMDPVLKEDINPDTIENDTQRIKILTDATLNIVRIIIEQYTSQKYEFNLAMDFFVQMADTNIDFIFNKILAEADLSDNSMLEINFGVYYAFSILLKKKSNKTEELLGLLDDKYKKFIIFPLHLEVYSRYYKRTDKYVESLRFDKRAIDILENRRITNAGVLISYASTICTMLEKNIIPKKKQLDLAFEYVDKAIKKNPDYPKYPFVKAKLTFLKALRFEKDTAKYAEAQEDANDLIATADMLLHTHFKNDNRYIQKEHSSYEKFHSYMEEVLNSLRFPKTHKELDDLKKAILSSNSHDDCYASDNLPPNPELTADDSYFFICYSSRDFKSVYSDLIELYKHKVHFLYDHWLISGHSPGWEEEIRKKVSSDKCLGVLFYLSENIFVGDSVHKEIAIAKEYDKAKLAVNLEGKSPSHILIDFIINQYLSAINVCNSCYKGIINQIPNAPTNISFTPNPNVRYIPGEQMGLFLTYFQDNIPFAKKQKNYGNDGKMHIKPLVTMITKAFYDEQKPSVIGDRNNEIAKY